MTFTITTIGTLSITAPTGTPTAIPLGSGCAEPHDPADHRRGRLSNFAAVTVTDNRATIPFSLDRDGLHNRLHNTTQVHGRHHPRRRCQLCHERRLGAPLAVSAGDIADDTSTVKTPGATDIAAPVGLTTTPTGHRDGNRLRR